MDALFVLSCALVPDWMQCASAFLHHVYDDHSQSLRSVSAYRTLLSQAFATKSPEHYTHHDAREFVRSSCRTHRDNLRGEPSPALQNARLSALSSFFAFASTYIPHGGNTPLYQKQSPTAGLHMRAQPSNPRGMREDEVIRFFAAIPSTTAIGLRDRAIFLLYLLTARRREEIARLRYGDIERAVFPDGQERRVGYRYRYLGKGKGKQAKYRELPRAAKEAIDRYLEASGRLSTISSDDPLFVSFLCGPGRVYRATEQPLRSKGIEERMKYYLRAAGFDPHAHSLHSFRHTSAQQRYEAGESILSINRLLDHVSLETTKRYLVNLVGESDPGAVLLERRFQLG